MDGWICGWSVRRGQAGGALKIKATRARTARCCTLRTSTLAHGAVRLSLCWASRGPTAKDQTGAGRAVEWISRTGVSLRPAVRSACSSLRPGPAASKSKHATQRQRHGHRARARRPFSICPALSTWPSPPGLAVRSYISTDPCNMQSPGQARTARRRTPTQHAATNSTRPSLHAGGHARVVCYCYEHCVTFAT
jgi:hypothetical protein